jgi:hypothetical protein
VTLAEVELLTSEERAARPLEAEAQGGVARAGESATVSVEVFNWGDAGQCGQVTAAEEPWLFDADRSQYDGRGRFAGNERYFIYRFPIRDGVTGGSLRLDLQAELLVQVSTDGQAWRTVLEETRRITDGSNRGWREMDVSELAVPARRSTCGSPTASRTTGGVAGSRGCGWSCRASREGPRHGRR